MLNSCLLVAILSLLASSQAFASPLLLSDVLSGEGKLVVAKTQTFSGTDRTGDIAYIQQYVYQGTYSSLLPRAVNDTEVLDESKLSCMSVVSTRGEQVTVPAGTALAWNTNELAPKRIDVFSQDGRTYEFVNLQFYGDDSRLTEFDCSVNVKDTDALPTLTADDFAAATNGAFTLMKTTPTPVPSPSPGSM